MSPSLIILIPLILIVFMTNLDAGAQAAPVLYFIMTPIAIGLLALCAVRTVWYSAALSAALLARTGVLLHISKASPAVVVVALATLLAIAVPPALPSWLDAVVGWDPAVPDTPDSLGEALAAIIIRYAAFVVGLAGFITICAGILDLPTTRPGGNPDQEPDEKVCDAAAHLIAGTACMWIAAAAHNLTPAHQILSVP